MTDRLRVCTGSTGSTGSSSSSSSSSSSTAVASTGSRIVSQIATAVALDPGNEGYILGQHHHLSRLHAKCL